MEIDLSAAEHNLLIRLVEGALSDTRVEVRRTTTPEFRDRLQTEEHQLAGLLERLRTSSAA